MARHKTGTYTFHGTLELSLLNPSGHPVRVVHTGPGHEMLFSLRELPSGLYFIRLKSGKHVEIKKVMVAH